MYMKPIRILKTIFAASIFLSVIIILLYSKPEDKAKVRLEYVVVHLDLKGAPPVLAYLESLLPLLKKYGANALLIEYEDMFPFEKDLVNISSKNSYKRKELKEFLTKAVSLGFEIIPLVQTFGHMEYVLKLPEFRHLREDQKHLDSICPSNFQSVELLKDILSQVIIFHQQIAPLKHIHVGCDEVFHMNSCERCTVMKMTDNISLFVFHLTQLRQIVSYISPNTVMLIWDDMIRKIKPYTIDQDFSESIEPAYWDYTPKVKDLRHVTLYTYHKMFPNIWIASAYKGADGKEATLPNFRDRISNHLSWMQLIQNYVFGGEKEPFKFKGIILTGWSRYTHVDPLCELLPLALPSLIANLILIEKYKEGIDNSDTKLNVDDFYKKYIEPEIKNDINCNSLIDSNYFNSKLCQFQGDKLLRTMIDYELLYRKYVELFYDNQYGLSYKFYTGAEFHSINKADTHWTNEALEKVAKIEIKLKQLMVENYDDNTVKEYISDKINNWKNKLQKLSLYLKKVFNAKTLQEQRTHSGSNKRV